MQNFTADDLVQTTLATLSFALFLLPPGYLLCLASNVFGMRDRSAAEKVLFSLAFSFAITPILVVLLTRASSYKVTLAFFLSLALISVFSLVRQLPRAAELFSGLRRSTWVLCGMALAWFLVVQFSLADLQVGHRLYLSYTIFDHSLRVSMVEAAVRSGVPPRNPFYGLGQLPVLRYFYYWYVVCALPVWLFGLRARACFNASVFWSGLGLASLVPLFLKYFLGEIEELRRKSVIGIALLSVTGLDVIAYAVWACHTHSMPPDMEWWDNNQVTSWLGSLLWVPHHVAALTACMAGLLALSAVDEASPLPQSAWAAVLAGLAFASAAGLSVYVVFAFAVFMVLWTLLMLVQKNIRTVAAYLAAGVFSLLLSWPYLQDLMSKQAGATGERFAFIGIRSFWPNLDILANLGIHSYWLLELEKLAMLLFVYAVEFGFFALVILLNLRRERLNPAPFSRQRLMAWVMFAVCLLTVSLVQSDTSGANDLGFRGMLVVQFVLLLWAAPIVDDVFFRPDGASQPGHRARWNNSPWIKIALTGSLALGVAGSALQLALLRVYAPLADTGRLERRERVFGSPGFGERTYWVREGFARLNELTSPDSTVQYNPVRYEYLVARLYSTRQIAMGDAFCGSAFGGDTAKCENAFPYFEALFNNPDAVRNWNVDRFCDDFGVHVLVATNADPVWDDPYSWVWMRPTLVANPMMRAVRCGTRTGSMADSR